MSRLRCATWGQFISPIAFWTSLKVIVNMHRFILLIKFGIKKKVFPETIVYVADISCEFIVSLDPHRQRLCSRWVHFSSFSFLSKSKIFSCYSQKSLGKQYPENKLFLINRSRNFNLCNLWNILYGGSIPPVIKWFFFFFPTKHCDNSPIWFLKVNTRSRMPL